MKKSVGANNKDVIQGLQKMIEEYEYIEKIFYTTTYNGYENEPEDIFGLVGKLYRLPINGPSIREQVERLKQKQLQVNQKKEHFVQIPFNANSSKVMQRLKIKKNFF
jgi:hypothetical protein